MTKCVDCKAEGIKSVRKTPYPGPRCATHHRAKRKERSSGNWEKHIESTYGITAEEYSAILKFQGGVCYICRRANGTYKRLSVDHCHSTGFVRGILCNRCNRILGHIRDDSDTAKRIDEYLSNPPAVAVIGFQVAPIEYERNPEVRALVERLNQ